MSRSQELLLFTSRLRLRPILIEAGIFVKAATSRTDIAGALPDIPGYADLGLSAEYAFNRKWSFWGEIGNLLCADIQRRPGLVESGPYVTLGVSLTVK